MPALQKRLAKRLLLIGWDAADWQIISPLLDAGKMPALNGLVERGVMGNLATLQPCLSPILWTSIATGKLADKHGVLGFVEPDGSGGIRTTASTSRKTKALWNILTQNGLRTHVIGWYASHPAEPINGVCVSNAFDLNPGPSAHPWPLPDGSVHPAKWREKAAEFRIHPTEITAAEMRFLIPDVAKIDLRSDPRPIELARCLAHNASVHAVATAVLENEPWDFLAVYYDLIDSVGHPFMPFHPPRMDHVPAREFALYQHVIERTYQLQDQMLGRLLELAGDDVAVVVVSDHGFLNDHRRPRNIPTGGPPEGMAAEWHRQFGMLCIAGEAMKQDERVYGATLLDVAPTVLTLLGVPPASDMDGRPLKQIFNEPIEPEMIPSWDDVAGEAGMHPPELRVDTVSAQETVDRLVALGYIDSASGDAKSGPRVAIDEAELNLAVVYMYSLRPAMAVPILQRLVQSHPDNARYAMTLASAYGLAKRPSEAKKLLESLEKKGARGADFDAMFGSALYDLGELDAALKRLLSSRRQVPDSQKVEATIAAIHMAKGNWRDAEDAYRRILQLEPESPTGNNGLARVLIELKDYENAAEHALRALDVAYHFPSAQFHLGRALEGIGMYDRAISAMETAVGIAPGFVEAHRHLASLFQRLGDPIRALKHERAAEGHVADDKSIFGMP